MTDKTTKKVRIWCPICEAEVSVWCVNFGDICARGESFSLINLENFKWPEGCRICFPPQDMDLYITRGQFMACLSKHLNENKPFTGKELLDFIIKNGFSTHPPNGRPFEDYPCNS